MLDVMRRGRTLRGRLGGSPRLGALARASAFVVLATMVLGACGSGGDGTPTPKAKSAASPSATASGGSIRPLDGPGAAAPPAAQATPEPVPSSVTSAFPGLPLDKVQAMNYNPDEKRLVLVTYLASGDVAGGRAVCNAFLGVALFDPNASIPVVATDYSPLASCAKN